MAGLVERLRRRWGWFDHAARAGTLYTDLNGGRLAAACSYFGFLAIFPLALLAFAVLGFLFRGNPDVTTAVADSLAKNFPVLAVGDIEGAKNTAGLLGLVGFYFAGLGWVDVLRTSLRTIWKREEAPGNLVVRKAIDAGVLLGLGLIAGLSLAVSAAATGGTRWALDLIGVDDTVGGRFGLGVLGLALSLAVDVVLFLALFTAVPRIRQPFRRLLWPAVMSAVGLEVLKTAGTLYISRTQTNPAYKAVAVAVGLLVFLYWLHQLLIYCAALTATDSREAAVDLGTGGDRLDPTDRSQADVPEPGSGAAGESADGETAEPSALSAPGGGGRAGA
jgi:membrane protein